MFGGEACSNARCTVLHTKATPILQYPSHSNINNVNSSSATHSHSHLHSHSQNNIYPVSHSNANQCSHASHLASNQFLGNQYNNNRRSPGAGFQRQLSDHSNHSAVVSKNLAHHHQQSGEDSGNDNSGQDLQPHHSCEYLNRFYQSNRKIANRPITHNQSNHNNHHQPAVVSQVKYAQMASHPPPPPPPPPPGGATVSSSGQIGGGTQSAASAAAAIASQRNQDGGGGGGGARINVKSVFRKLSQHTPHKTGGGEQVHILQNRSSSAAAGGGGSSANQNQHGGHISQPHVRNRHDSGNDRRGGGGGSGRRLGGRGGEIIDETQLCSIHSSGQALIEAEGGVTHGGGGRRDESVGRKSGDVQETAPKMSHHHHHQHDNHRGHYPGARGRHESPSAFSSPVRHHVGGTWSKASQAGGVQSGTACTSVRAFRGYATTRRLRASFTRPGRNAFLSQLYLAIHIAFTICLLKHLANYKDDSPIAQTLGIPYPDLVYYYYGYLMGTSFLFLLMLRCCTLDEDEIREELACQLGYGKTTAKLIGLSSTSADKDIIRSNYTALLLGAICLGVIQLVSIGLDISQCLESDHIFMPVLHFVFVFFIMHFILVQVTHDERQMFNNIALAHLLATQVSLWVTNFNGKFNPCALPDGDNPKVDISRRSGYTPANYTESHATSTTAAALMPTSMFESIAEALVSVTTPQPHLPPGYASQVDPSLVDKRSILPKSILELLHPLVHHYQLLIISVVLTIWWSNNRCGVRQSPGSGSGPGFIGDATARLGALVRRQSSFLTDGELTREFTSHVRHVGTGFSGLYTMAAGHWSIKGLILGLLILTGSAVVLVLGDEILTACAHTAIQAMCGLMSFIGLIVSYRTRYRGVSSKIKDSEKPTKGKSATGYLGYKYYASAADLPESELSNGGNVWNQDLTQTLTVFAVYYYGITLVLNNLLSGERELTNLIVITNGCMLVAQVTLQTFLIRSRGSPDEPLSWSYSRSGLGSSMLSNVYAFLALSNLALWILEVTDAATFLTAYGRTDLISLVPLLVALNRLHASLVFVQYWRTK